VGEESGEVAAELQESSGAIAYAEELKALASQVYEVTKREL
jgi:hypothetical protein